MNNKPRPIPGDFLEMREKLGGRDKLATHYRTSGRVVRRWLVEAGLQPIRTTGAPERNRKPVPDDFETVAPTMTQTELVRHYGVGREVVLRWQSETGISPAPRKRPSFVYRFERHPGPVKVHAVRNYSPEDEAADVLRRYFPTYRCDERGRQCAKGSLWRVGNGIYAADELLAKAARYRERAA